MSSINVSSIWATFILSLASASAFNVSVSSKSCLLFINSNSLLAHSSILSANILAFSVSRRNLKRLSLDFIEVLDELDEDLELFDDYLDLTETSGNVFFEFFTLNFDVSKN